MNVFGMKQAAVLYFICYMHTNKCGFKLLKV